jgi:hypothetical protein
MSTSTTLKLALDMAAKVTGWEVCLHWRVRYSRMSDYAYRLIGFTSWLVR